VSFPNNIYRKYNIYKAVKGVRHLFENWYLFIYIFSQKLTFLIYSGGRCYNMSLWCLILKERASCTKHRNIVFCIKQSKWINWYSIIKCILYNIIFKLQINIKWFKVGRYIESNIMVCIAKITIKTMFRLLASILFHMP
jgi:hypothetical protein